jgi:hypothetical protein
MLEYWNNGKMKEWNDREWKIGGFPIFHHSIIPTNG